jgi:hypothetical protein
VADAEPAVSRSHSTEPLAPAEWEAVAAVEERAHSGHDAAFRPSEKPHIYLTPYLQVQGLIAAKRVESKMIDSNLNKKDLKRHKKIFPSKFKTDTQYPSIMLPREFITITSLVPKRLNSI